MEDMARGAKMAVGCLGVGCLAIGLGVMLLVVAPMVGVAWVGSSLQSTFEQADRDAQNGK